MKSWQSHGLSQLALLDLLDRDVSNLRTRTYTVNRAVFQVLVYLGTMSKASQCGITILVCDSVPEGRFYIENGSKESCGCPQGCRQSTD